MLEFDNKGHLIPYTIIQSSPEELESDFVTNLPSQTRRKIFENYRNYLSVLSSACDGIPFIQWVNGSFTTRKKDPADIDIVSFIDHTVLLNSAKIFEPLAYPGSYTFYEVDAYIVPVYPENHKSGFLYTSDRLDWMDNFNKTWYNRNGRRYPKGFLELKINS